MIAMNVVHVVWIDASAKSDWTPLSELESSGALEPTHSVGVLIKETENSLILAMTYDPTTDLTNAIMEIPLPCVEDVRPLCKIQLKR